MPRTMADIIATLQEHEALVTRMNATVQLDNIVANYIATLINAQRASFQVAELPPEAPTPVRRATAAAQPAARTTEPFGHQASPAHRADERQYLPLPDDETLEIEETHTTRVRKPQAESLFDKFKKRTQQNKEN